MQSTLPNIIFNIIDFINRFLVPLVFALAFAFFLWGVFNYFFLKQKDPKAREEGRGFIVGSVVALAVMLSLWGLVNLVKGTLSLNNNQPDLPTFNAKGGNGNGNSSGAIPAPANSTSGATPAPANSTSGATPAPTSGTSGAVPAGNSSDPVNGLY